MIIALWISLFVVAYTFVGYGFLLYFIIKIKRAFKGKPMLPVVSNDDLPTCTLVVAAYNEEHFITQKIANSLQLNYPEGKLKFVFVTDGSSDKTPDIIQQ